MKITWNILLGVAAWCALLAYFVFAAGYCSRRSSDVVCSGINVVVRDIDELKFVTPEVVKNILASDNIKVTGEELSSINTLAIEKSLSKKAYIKKARVYTSIDGKLNIEIEQRRPVMRIQTESGYNIYISDDNYVLPIQRYFHVDVPVVTGAVRLPFAADFSGELPKGAEAEKKYGENYRFLYNLINFVEFMRRDSFWNSQIVQINVAHNGDIELVQRVGDYIVNMGGFDDYSKKLGKLLVFYRKGLVYEGWNTYKYINIAYKDQIYCSR